MDPLRIVVTGLIAQYPLGGVTWDYVQWVLGLSALGHDVYYFEDSGQWPYNPEQQGVSNTCEFNVAYLSDVMSRFDLADSWAYRFPWQSQWFGLSAEKREEVLKSADVLINVSASLGDLNDYGQVGKRIFIDSDPVFTQVRLAKGQGGFRSLVDQHDICFSFGENLTPESFGLGIEWLPIRQPIVLSEWEPVPEGREAVTTVMNWTSYSTLEFEGTRYGQKDVEFRRFMTLPEKVRPIPLEVAMGVGKSSKAPHELLAHRGWSVVDPAEVCQDMESYRHYIRNSRAEWSVAKNGYVQGQPGWFSCRSACYLAAGRPVVVQETGFSDVLPVGEGIVAFRSLDEASDGLRSVVADYPRHSAAARDIASEYFDSSKVLSDLLDRASVRENLGGFPTSSQTSNRRSADYIEEGM